jgi:sulfopyruvate decarboxylase TPP-binding subunit
MGQAVVPTLEAVGVKTFLAETPEAVDMMIESGLRMAYSTDTPVAVLVGQKVIGSKVWTAGKAVNQ